MKTRSCLALALLLAGCDRGFQSFEGTVASDGGGLGTWNATPEGCSRAPVVPEQVVSFFWENPADHDIRLRDQHTATAPDVPEELDLVRDGQGFAGRIKTVKGPGWGFERRDCAELLVDSSEEPPKYTGGRPTLRGRVRLDCRVRGSRLTADVRFRRCEF